MKYLLLILLALILMGCPTSNQQPEEIPQGMIDSSDVHKDDVKRFGE